MRDAYAEFHGHIKVLRSVTEATHQRAIQEPPDTLFLNNINFFVKAYLVSLCTCLEAFLQEVAFEHVSQIKQRVAAARMPHNVVIWSIAKDAKEKDMQFKEFQLEATRKDLADELSGNPGKTIALFKRLGVDLQSHAEFKASKDVVGAVVAKRNNVIHHNDSAADVSLADVIVYSEQFLRYIRAIADCVAAATPALTGPSNKA